MKKIMTILAALLLCMMMGMTAMAHPSRLIDEADVFTDTEETELLAMLDRYSVENLLDIVVVIVDSLDGESAEVYADDYFDYNGYGMGEDYDGVLLLVSIEDRQWYISTCGYAIAAMSDNRLDHMADEIVPYLSAGEYVEAVEEYVVQCAGAVKQARSAGVVYEETTSEGMGNVTAVLASLIIGFILAFIPMLSMKKKMKTVVARQEAAEYMDRSSAQITRSHDRFLYHTISRVYTPPQETSTTHTSSSGMSHGGRGGSF